MAQVSEAKVPTAVDEVPPGTVCSGCGQEGKIECPICAKLKAPKIYYCSQECFKQNFNNHASVHQLYMKVSKFVPPPFNYTGTLRPHYVSPRRKVPDHIPKPDYAEHGDPISERISSRGYTTPIYTQQEIEGIRLACQKSREVLDMAANMIKPGVLPEDIDAAVHNMCIEMGAYPSPLNYKGFPKSCCISVNEVICHGIPDFRPLQNGDIVNIDISVYYKGYHGDVNETFVVGEVDEVGKQLIKTSYFALEEAIKIVRPGTLFRDFGEVISSYCQRNGKFSVVRSYGGHGIGELFHCAPNIPHYAKNKAVGACRPGMIFTIEPMVNEGTYQDVTWPDDWTVATADGKRSAQFEHTILVTKDGCEVLTARTSKSKKQWWEEEAETAAGATTEATEAKE